jgi:hypothetical protein
VTNAIRMLAQPPVQWAMEKMIGVPTAAGKSYWAACIPFCVPQFATSASKQHQHRFGAKRKPLKSRGLADDTW